MRVVVLALQAPERSWVPKAVHDTVQAVLSDPAFRRSVRSSLLDRFLSWLADVFDQLDRLFKHLPSTRSFGLALVALLVLFVVVRVVIAAMARDDGSEGSSDRRSSTATNDPWRDAEGLASQGRYEEAVHALYRGVILALGRDERLRLDPSKTSGDYARELRRRGSATLAPFRDFTRRFDVAVYGHGGVDEAVYAELRLLSTAFRPAARAA
jgi:hypothetical protein